MVSRRSTAGVLAAAALVLAARVDDACTAVPPGLPTAMVALPCKPVALTLPVWLKAMPALLKVAVSDIWATWFDSLAGM